MLNEGLGDGARAVKFGLLFLALGVVAFVLTSLGIFLWPFVGA